jgi:two-component system chemotaxis response regulator CheY
MSKVLVVDDSAMSRRIVRSILESAGYEVVEAADGILALEKYFLDKPDVVLLDLVMSGMYGLDVLAKLREIDPRASVVVATADIQSSTRKMAEDGGALSVVTKPFVAADLIAAVTGALEERTDGADRKTK